MVEKGETIATGGHFVCLGRKVCCWREVGVGPPKMSLFLIAILKYATQRGLWKGAHDCVVCGGGERQFGSLSLAEWIGRN